MQFYEIIYKQFQLEFISNGLFTSFSGYFFAVVRCCTYWNYIIYLFQYLTDCIHGHVNRAEIIQLAYPCGRYKNFP